MVATRVPKTPQIWLSRVSCFGWGSTGWGACTNLLGLGPSIVIDPSLLSAGMGLKSNADAFRGSRHPPNGTGRQLGE